jgi:hypothetical protein
VPGVVLFSKSVSRKENRREIKKARKSKQSLAKQLNDCVIEVKGSCEKRQSYTPSSPCPCHLASASFPEFSPICQLFKSSSGFGFFTASRIAVGAIFWPSATLIDFFAQLFNVLC